MLCFLGCDFAWAAHITLSAPAFTLLCRRQDALGAALAAGRRSTLQPASGTHRLSVAADNAGLVAGSPGWAPNRRSLSLHGRRSSVAPSRLSTCGGHNMLSRLSLGLTDALQWLGIKGKIPTAAAGEGQQAAAAPHAGANGAAGVLDRPALSPIASPGLEEGCESPAEPSPLAGAAAAPADPEQQLKGVQQVATETAATAEPASVVAVEDLPAPSKHQAGGKQPAAVAEPDAEIASAAAATAPRDAAAVEQLGQHLAETLQLQAAKVEAAAEVKATAASASAEADAAGREAAPEEAASEAETAEPEEELTPLQQLLVLCGQEVGGPYGACVASTAVFQALDAVQSSCLKTCSSSAPCLLGRCKRLFCDLPWPADRPGAAAQHGRAAGAAC